MKPRNRLDPSTVSWGILPTLMQTDRRGFMKISAGSAVALSTMSTGAWLSGCTSASTAPGMAFLRPEDIVMLEAFVPSILAGQVGPGETDKINGIIQSFDELLGSTSQIVVDLIQQAFDALSLAPARGLMTGQWSSWSKASVADTDRALARLRDSKIELLNAIYAAMIRMVASAYYLIPEYQRTTGYPGPPKKQPAVLPAVDRPVVAEEPQ